MYIKKVKKSNSGSKKTYYYLHLVENVRTPSGPRQRLILNLGRLNIPRDKYKELANCIEAPDGHFKIPHLWPGQNTPATG